MRIVAFCVFIFIYDTIHVRFLFFYFFAYILNLVLRILGNANAHFEHYKFISDFLTRNF
jgi:uncharacterized membrane protein